MAKKTDAPALLKRSGSKSVERWDQILKVATQLFREKGFSATSMQDVSDAVGLLKGSLYYYVRSKEDLLVAILWDLHKNGEAIIAEIDFECGNPLDVLSDFLADIVVYSVENADRLAIFLRDFQFVPKERQSGIIIERGMYTEATERLIKRAMALGQVSSGIHPRIAANTVLRGASSIHEWYSPTGSLPLPKVARQIGHMLVHGLGTSEGKNAK